MVNVCHLARQRLELGARQTEIDRGGVAFDEVTRARCVGRQVVERRRPVRVELLCTMASTSAPGSLRTISTQTGAREKRREPCQQDDVVGGPHPHRRRVSRRRRRSKLEPEPASKMNEPPQ